ncbi:hypothetical protein T492DRAFT_985746 [Pavlovales sp. CCMP2436]|nr:hypothetical protein T492DRAFT_985746 [Pavlovales sp. CCMP2436]
MPTGGRARATALVAGDVLLVCGGESPHPTEHGACVRWGDLWSLDLKAPSKLGWVRVHGGHATGCVLPTRTLEPSLALLHAGRTLLVFGGHEADARVDFGDPVRGFLAPPDALALRLTLDGGGYAVVRSARCRESADCESTVHAARAWPTSFALSPGTGTLIACGAHATEDRMVVQALSFTS